MCSERSIRSGSPEAAEAFLSAEGRFDERVKQVLCRQMLDVVGDVVRPGAIWKDVPGSRLDVVFSEFARPVWTPAVEGESAAGWGLRLGVGDPDACEFCGGEHSAAACPRSMSRQGVWCTSWCATRQHQARVA